MYKIFYLLVLSVFIYAKEPTLAILYSIKSNDMQKFNIDQYSFNCSPYGVVSLETLYKRSKKDSECRDSIYKFFIQNPKLKYFTQNILYIEQTYHIDFKQNMCILYAKGETSLSELLLKNGLAVLKPSLKDEEYRYRFKTAEVEAKISKKGLWSEDIEKNCISEILGK